MRVLSVALFVLAFFVTVLVVETGVVFLGSPRWLEGIVLAGSFVFGWYHRRLYALWQRVTGL